MKHSGYPDPGAASSTAPSRLPWSPQDLQEALKVFLRTGDCQPCLKVLGATTGRNPLLALQQALRSATATWERDALEDIGFELSRGQGGLGTARPDIQDLLQEVERHYGPHALQFLSVEKTEAIVRGLWRLCSPPPSRECLLALLGIEIARAVGEPIAVTPEVHGKSVTLYNKQCGNCGGESDGAGTVYCHRCLAEAKKVLKAGLADGTYNVKEGATSNMDVLSRMFLRQFAAMFGCTQCSHQPVKPCSCAREVEIPEHPVLGQVLKGRQLATGNDWFCYVRLVEG
ncbi:MAG: hypothetical protein GX456_06895 [Verrucomicrobia bacterium]|nr:hypothetical protein [Verrucomicrobiota bacterium]